jgi:hypothetical protein
MNSGYIERCSFSKSIFLGKSRNYLYNVPKGKTQNRLQEWGVVVVEPLASLAQLALEVNCCAQTCLSVALSGSSLYWSSKRDEYDRFNMHNRQKLLNELRTGHPTLCTVFFAKVFILPEMITMRVSECVSVFK